MWPIIRIFVAFILSFETLFAGIFGGVNLQKNEMPEIPEGEYNPSEVSLFPCIYGTDRTCVPFERALPYVEKYPERFVLGFAPDPRRPDALDRLKYAVKAFGVRVCGEVKFRMMLDNFDATTLFRWCGENGLPLPCILSELSRYALGCGEGCGRIHRRGGFSYPTRTTD